MYAKGVLDSFSLPAPVVSIGNIELGGTGKTPFTAWLVEYLEQKNLKGSVLTRGYKRTKSIKDGVQVSSRNVGLVDVAIIGDEPMLLAKNMKNSTVIVGPNRLENYYSRTFLQKDDFIILEDGHQHLKILRDLNIVLVNANTPVEHFKCFPSGFLREGLSALLEADVLIFSKCSEENRANQSLLKSHFDNFLKPNVVKLGIKFVPKYLKNLKSGEIIEPDRVLGCQYGVFSGIAKVTPFLNDLKLIGVGISDQVIFDNHHSYNKSSYQKINNLVNTNGLVCTEKDAVKLDLTKIKGDVFSLVNDVEFIEGESRIKDVLDKVINC